MRLANVVCNPRQERPGRRAGHTRIPARSFLMTTFWHQNASTGAGLRERHRDHVEPC